MTEYEPMDPAIRDAWADVVLARRFTRGKGFLCHKYGAETLYDPLGMLCELAVEAGEIQSGSWVEHQIVRFKRYHGEQGLLPKEVVGWAKLHSQNPCIRLTGPERALLRLPGKYQWHQGFKFRPVPLVIVNDHGEVTDAQLAELIRKL